MSRCDRRKLNNLPRPARFKSTHQGEVHNLDRVEITTIVATSRVDILTEGKTCVKVTFHVKIWLILPGVLLHIERVNLLVIAFGAEAT